MCVDSHHPNLVERLQMVNNIVYLVHAVYSDESWLCVGVFSNLEAADACAQDYLHDADIVTVTLMYVMDDYCDDK